MSRNMITFGIKWNVVVLIQTDQANFKNSKTMLRKSSIAILILEQMASFRILFFHKRIRKSTSKIDYVNFQIERKLGKSKTTEAYDATVELKELQENGG